MASSRNMKVWSRCIDCGEWGEDCDCVCGFVREQEETLIHFSDFYSLREDDRELRDLEIRYNAGGYGGWSCSTQCNSGCPACHGSPPDPGPVYDCDCDYDDEEWCEACGRVDCSGDGWSMDCDWLSWAEELLSRRSNPLYQLAEGLGVLWQA